MFVSPDSRFSTPCALSPLGGSDSAPLWRPQVPLLPGLTPIAGREDSALWPESLPKSAFIPPHTGAMCRVRFPFSPDATRTTTTFSQHAVITVPPRAFCPAAAPNPSTIVAFQTTPHYRSNSSILFCSTINRHLFLLGVECSSFPSFFSEFA